MIRRVAMWSGPRNISTAMMRSWGSRADTVVCDEPFYARYLARTGLEHPGREEILAAGQLDLSRIVDSLLAPLPPGKSIFYQKHMAHHTVEEDDYSWCDDPEFRHGFLIREPREMITSFIRVIPDPTPAQLGLPQQVRLLERMRAAGIYPPIVDARDVLESPRRTLEKLCHALEVPFDVAMLSWPAGPRATDGVWARHWYDSVNRSTTFEPYRPKEEQVPTRLASALAECDRLYRPLWERRLRP